MNNKEIKESTLRHVVEVTLDEYLDDCRRDGHRKDKSSYIRQILSKVEDVRPKLKVNDSEFLSHCSDKLP